MLKKNYQNFVLENTKTLIETSVKNVSQNIINNIEQ